MRAIDGSDPRLKISKPASQGARPSRFAAEVAPLIIIPAGRPPEKAHPRASDDWEKPVPFQSSGSLQAAWNRR